MALTGSFERTLDEKLRLAIPREMRDALTAGGHPVLAPGNEGSLSLYSAEGFQSFAAKLGSLSHGQLDVRNYTRLLYGLSQEVKPDSQFRIRLPERLQQHAALGKNVVLVGANDHVEIWDRDRWEAFLTQTAPRFDELTGAACNAMLQPPEA